MWCCRRNQPQECPRDRSPGAPPPLLFGAATLLAVLLLGCATPRCVASLDGILQQAGRGTGAHYGYRCTVGAHRGASQEHRENTAAALAAADRDPRYAFIEFDIQYSRDGRIVVFHDKRLLRLFGNPRAIGQTTFARLSEISGGEIVAYDQVIGRLTKRLNIEVKSQGDDREDERLVDELLADLSSRRREKDVLISSISGNVVRYVKQKYPGIRTGQVFWLSSSTYLHFDILTKRLYADAAATGADYLMLHVANLRNIDDLLALKPRGKTIVFWDFDDTIYIVHKDLSDRLWGDSGVTTLWQSLRYRIASLLGRRPPEPSR